jgi:acyl-coenzyme A synthetase/AMP-(fatty) acid ligase
MESIVEALAAHAADPLRHSRLCLADGSRDVTYEEAWQLVRRTAARLTALGLGRGDRVMIKCTQDVRYMASMLACQLAGIVPVPLEKGASEGRMKGIAEETEAAVFIGTEDPGIGVRFLDYDELFDDSEDAENADSFSFPKSEDAAEILFTTGTTGKPKGIILSHRSNVSIAENVTDGLHMEEDNIELIPMPLSHSHGLRRTYSNIWNGSTAVLIDGVIRVKLFFDMIERYHVTSIDISPAILSMLFRLSKDKIAEYNGQIRYVQLGSAPLPEESKERLSADLPDARLYDFYGTTEAGCSCILDFNLHEGREHCIGRPAKNASFMFTDEDRHPVKATEEEPGFIATAGGQNMIGYLNEPELTAEVCRDGYIFTNDLGYMDENGYIYCLGRRDDVINCGGIKIAPEEIEEEVIKYKSLVDCACVPIPDRIQGQVPKLFIQLSGSEEDFDRQDFTRFMEERLDRNKIPKKIEIIEKIPRTYNGKVQRKKLMVRG